MLIYKYTDSRGLETVDFNDFSGNRFRLHQSTQRSEPAMFIRRDRLSQKLPTDMSLNRETVKFLIEHLQAWLDTDGKSFDKQE